MSALPSPPTAALKRARGRPRKTLDERDEGNRRQQLLKAAARLFRRKGFDATSTRDIAAAVGMQVRRALAAEHRLPADVHLARLMIFGALNWTVQWFDAKKRASLDELTDAAMALFIHEEAQ